MADTSTGHWQILPAPHLGDAYFTCALASAFLERHGGTLVRVVLPKQLWGILKIFPDAPVTPADPSDVSGPFRSTKGANPEEPFELRPIDHWKYFGFQYFGNKLPFTRMYHDLLDLPFPSFTVPRVPAECREAAKERMRALDLPPGRTVILVPFSKSLAPFTISFWQELASTLQRLGLTVVTNATTDQLSIPGTQALDCPAEELIPAAELAGMVIASRCGVCDVLSSAQTDLRILYQTAQMEQLRMPGVDLNWDLGECGLTDHAFYYRLGLYEPHTEFIRRILADRL